MNAASDTIAAISTAPGESGIAIIRLSGPLSLVIADTIFQCNSPLPSQRAPGTFVLGHVLSHDNKTGATHAIDQAILLIFHAPHSYTGDHVIEIQGHGGRTCATRILRTVLDAGAVPAHPGEFTRRAFINNRIDLLQAEAVLDLIRSRSERAASTALQQLQGSLSSSLENIYNTILEIACNLEATLDFDDGELPETVLPHMATQLADAILQIQLLLDTWEEGHLLREGALVVISGLPNVGKSTMLNALLGSDRAIVTDMPGTTRDTVEEQIIIDGVPIRLVDTAGLRDTSCIIEQEGIRRTKDSMQSADANVHVLDASSPMTQDTLHHISTLDPGRTVIALNKTDLGQSTNQSDLPKFRTLSCSLIGDASTSHIKEAISTILNLQGTESTPPHATISQRHKQALILALAGTEEAKELLNSRRDETSVLAATALRTALELLGNITGRSYSNELLDGIFSRFCIGK